MTGGEFILSRSFAAPREAIWQAWIEPDRLMKWWAPPGFAMQSAKVDLRPGGMYHYGMKAPDGSEVWGKLAYREIAAPERLVFLVSFSNARGQVIRHPWNASWPFETLSTATFADGGGVTTLTVTAAPFESTPEEIRTFALGYEGMREVWTGTLDKLADYLARA
jgi:uncharacterized protein YndB with AHSA1/START domain